MFIGIPHTFGIKLSETIQPLQSGGPHLRQGPRLQRPLPIQLRQGEVDKGPCSGMVRAGGPDVWHLAELEASDHTSRSLNSKLLWGGMLPNIRLGLPSCRYSPTPRCAHQAVIHKNVMYVFGGEVTSPNQVIECADITGLLHGSQTFPN